jgi:hypothetical protein
MVMPLDASPTYSLTLPTHGAGNPLASAPFDFKSFDDGHALTFFLHSNKGMVLNIAERGKLPGVLAKWEKLLVTWLKNSMQFG